MRDAFFNKPLRQVPENGSVCFPEAVRTGPDRVAAKTFTERKRVSTMQDILKPITGNKMLELKQEIKELREILAQTDDPEKIKTIKRAIADKQTHYNILADRARLQR